MKCIRKALFVRRINKQLKMKTNNIFSVFVFKSTRLKKKYSNLNKGFGIQLFTVKQETDINSIAL